MWCFSATWQMIVLNLPSDGITLTGFAINENGDLGNAQSNAAMTIASKRLSHELIRCHAQKGKKSGSA